MKFDDLKIGYRLWGSILVLSATLLGVGAYTVQTANVVHAETLAKADQVQALVSKAASWKALTQLTVTRYVSMTISGNAVLNDMFREAASTGSAKITKLREELMAEATTEEDKALFARLKQRSVTMLAAAKKMNDLSSAGNHEGAEAIVTSEYAPGLAAYLATIDEFVSLQQRKSEQVRTVSQAANARVMALAGFTAVLAIAFALFVATILMRSVKRPLQDALDLAGAISKGDLTHRLMTDRRDEFGQLMSALQQMTLSLARVIGSVRTSTDSIRTASFEISCGNIDLSQRTEETASNLQQTASSMEQLTAAVRQSAEAASRANELASSAFAVASRGGQVVAQVVATMDEINAASKKISDIIGVIDGIAFQTNILALNAAVEAARAGEQGRGFAVVASEVRSLAQRSAEAAKEIKALIGTSVDKVETGSKLVQDAGTTMDEIVTAVQRVSHIIGEITATASEQSTGIDQINTAVAQVDQMTQQNAALVEQSSAAAESLKHQAEQLADAVSIFQLAEAAA